MAKAKLTTKLVGWEHSKGEMPPDPKTGEVIEWDNITIYTEESDVEDVHGLKTFSYKAKSKELEIETKETGYPISFDEKEYDELKAILDNSIGKYIKPDIDHTVKVGKDGKATMKLKGIRVYE